jgi:hypothetical protein
MNPKHRVTAIPIALVCAGILAGLAQRNFKESRLVEEEQEQQRLQALANTEPWQVFELRAKPAKEAFVEGEDIYILCELRNKTNYPLTPPKEMLWFDLAFKDTDFFVGQNRSGLVIPPTAIAPGESQSCELMFYPFGPVESEFRVSYQDVGYGGSVVSVGGRGIDLMASIDENGFQSNLFQLVVALSDYSDYPTFEEMLAGLTE